MKPDDASLHAQRGSDTRLPLWHEVARTREGAEQLEIPVGDIRPAAADPAASVRTLVEPNDLLGGSL